MLPVFYFQSSFIGDSKGHHPIDGDIEMGIRGSRSNPDMGMEAFNKKVFDTIVYCPLRFQIPWKQVMLELCISLYTLHCSSSCSCSILFLKFCF